MWFLCREKKIATAVFFKQQKLFFLQFFFFGNQSDLRL